MAAFEIGEIKSEFRPGRANLVAGMIIGLMMITGGCTILYFGSKGLIESRGNLAFWTEKDWCWVSLGLFGGLAIVLILSGSLLIRWIQTLSRITVWVGTTGFCVSERNANDVFHWDEITFVEETRLYERPPLLKGIAKYALPKLMSRSFVIIRRHGDTFGFSGTTIKRHVELADLIKEETNKRSIPWEVEEVHRDLL
ncbi:MAG: hypothetical protein K8T91_12995 [Planctomycetes bacterium]|nr:hypothetical protein [Planctomycetota bacterium]